MLIMYVINNTLTEETKLNILILSIVIIVTITVGLVLTAQEYKNENRDFEEDVEYINRVIADTLGEILEDNIKSINSAKDYNTPQYKKMEQILDQYTENGYEMDYGIFYKVIKEINGRNYVIMDSEKVSPVIYSENEVDQIIKKYDGKKTIILPRYEDDYGIWALTISRIYGKNNNILGHILVGMNKNSIVSNYQKKFIDMTLILFSVVILILFLFNAGIEFFDAQNKLFKGMIGGEKSINFIIFLVYIATGMQISFIPVLSIDMYNKSPITWLPESIGTTLPLTMEMFAFVIAGTMGGKLLERISLEKALYYGLLILAGGCLAASFSTEILRLTITKLFIGLGSGLANIIINVMASSLSDSNRRENLVSGLNIKLLSGTFVGLIIGSYIHTSFSYKGVYLSGVIFVIIAMLTTYLCKSIKWGEIKSNISKDKKAISFISFISQRKIWSFTFLLVIPLYIGIEFFNFYMPIIGGKQGLNTEQIGQIMMLGGICSIYAGPYLTKLILNKFGGLIGSVISCIALALGILLFAFNPTTITMIIASVFFGMVFGFAYAVQETYYYSLDELEAYGVGNAVSVNSLFSGIAETVAPMIIASFMMFSEKGIMFITALLGIFIVIFLCSNVNQLRYNKK